MATLKYDQLLRAFKNFTFKDPAIGFLLPKSVAIFVVFGGIYANVNIHEKNCNAIVGTNRGVSIELCTEVARILWIFLKTLSWLVFIP